MEFTIQGDCQCIGSTQSMQHCYVRQRQIDSCLALIGGLHQYFRESLMRQCGAHRFEPGWDQIATAYEPSHALCLVEIPIASLCYTCNMTRNLW